MGHSLGIVGLYAMADGKTIVSASRDGTIRFWDTTTCLEKSILHVEKRLADCFAVSSDESMCATGGTNGEIRLMHLPK